MIAATLISALAGVIYCSGIITHRPELVSDAIFLQLQAIFILLAERLTRE